MRESLFKPLGLVTEPNAYGQYPAGALSRADNCFMRKPGLVVQMPTPALLASGFGAGAIVRKLASTNKQLLAIMANPGNAAGIYWLDRFGVASAQVFADAATNLTNAFGGYASAHPRIITQLFRDRTLVTTRSGIIAADYINPANAAERAFRWAGLPQPLAYAFRLVNTTLGQAMTDNTVVTYAVTIEREYADGYKLISEPSQLARVKCPAGSGPCSIGMKVRFGGNDPTATGRAGIRAGDKIRIWRSQPVSSVGLGLNTESGPTLFLAKTYTIVSGDLSLNTTGQIVDDSSPSSLTEELYTNPGQQGLMSIRRRPPQAETISTFQGSTFYGRCQVPAAWTARFPNGLGWLSLGNAGTRARGIGIRSITGTFAPPANTITGVSAADQVGLVVGQYLGGSSKLAASAVITSLAPAGTITVSGVTSGGAGADSFYSIDRLFLDGTDYKIPDLQGFIDEFAGPGAPGAPYPFYAITSAQTIAYRETPAVVSAGTVQLVFNQGFRLEPGRFVQGNITVRGTNGANYDPPIPNLTDPVATFSPTAEPNRVWWSWDQQPEAVAPPNSTPVGLGEIYASVATRDAVWYFTSSGLYRVSGYSTRSSGIGAQWRTDLIDAKLFLADPHAFCVLRDSIYAYTNRGLVEILNGAVRELSTGIVGDLLPGAIWQTTPLAIDLTFFLFGDESTDEVWIGVQDVALAPAITFYIYNAVTQAFTRAPTSATAGAWMGFLDETISIAAPVAGANDVSYLPIAPASYLDAPVDYQPIHMGDPMALKQWVDMAVVCDPASVGRNVSPTFNGVSGTPVALAARQNDARRNFGVPRNAPALGHTLAPGLTLIAGDTPIELRGVSLRCEALTDQQDHR